MIAMALAIIELCLTQIIHQAVDVASLLTAAFLQQGRL
jgi:hypothetical protein